MAPFAGLCVAVLIYLPNDLTGGGFNVSIGEKGRIYAIGWNVDSKWGLHSVTYTDDTKGYLGRKDDTVKTFKKGYSYLYFYFKNSDTLNVDFKDADIFEMRTGTVVTVRTKYKKNYRSSNTGVIIGVGCATCTNSNFTSRAFPECADAYEVYTFVVNLSEKGALIYKNEGDVSYLPMPSYDALHAKCRAYLTFDNVKPVHIQVETMGQRWV